MLAKRLMIDVPYLHKGEVYLFDHENNEVWLEGFDSEYPLRKGLAGYLWLLSTDGKYMRKVRR